MKTKIYITMCAFLMSVQISIAQQITYGDVIETRTLEKKCEDGCDVITTNNITPYYMLDEVAPNAFKTENNTLVVCRLIKGSEKNIVCSTSMPDKGWGMMMPLNNGKYIIEDVIHSKGAKINSIAFTDPKHGWAVGVMENYSQQNGVIFNTVDGGKSWDLQSISGSGLELISVGFTDAKHGLVKGMRKVGDTTYEIILVTSDGGEIWQQQNAASLKGTLSSSESSLFVSN